MMAEIQGLSASGGAAGGFGFAGSGSSSAFSGPGTMAGRAAAGYLGPGLHGRQSGMDAGVAAEAGRGVEDGGTGTVGQKQGGAAGERGVGAEWDAAVLGGMENGEPLSPRNREYRRKMIEMNAEHKVRDSARLLMNGMDGGGAVGVDEKHNMCWLLCYRGDECFTPPQPTVSATLLQPSAPLPRKAVATMVYMFSWNGDELLYNVHSVLGIMHRMPAAGSGQATGVRDAEA